jgi:hypothetical protein
LLWLLWNLGLFKNIIRIYKRKKTKPNLTNPSRPIRPNTPNPQAAAALYSQPPPLLSPTFLSLLPLLFSPRSRLTRRPGSLQPAEPSALPLPWPGARRVVPLQRPVHPRPSGRALEADPRRPRHARSRPRSSPVPRRRPQSPCAPDAIKSRPRRDHSLPRRNGASRRPLLLSHYSLHWWMQLMVLDDAGWLSLSSPFINWRRISSPSHSRALLLPELPLSFSHFLLAHVVVRVRPRHRSPPRHRGDSPELAVPRRRRARTSSNPSPRHALEPVCRRPFTQGWRPPTNLFSKSCFESCDLLLMRFGDSRVWFYISRYMRSQNRPCDTTLNMRIILKMNTVTIHYFSDFHTRNVLFRSSSWNDNRLVLI